MTNTSGQLHIAPLQKENIHLLAVLAQAVYGHAPSADYFVKKYNTAFTGVMYMGYLAIANDGTPAAFYGVIPCFLQSGGQKIAAAQSADTMTHPDHRGLGLFTQLADLTYELCRKHGVRLIFGFPNQNSYPGFVNKLGWQHTETMEGFSIPACTVNWERLIKKLPVIRQLYPAYLRLVLGKHRVQQNGVPGTSTSGVLRDDDFLGYKTYNQTYVINIENSLVWLKFKNGLIIGDICLCTDNFDVLMQKLIRIARRAGMKQLLFQTSPGTRLHTEFKQRYAAAESFPVIFMDLRSGAELHQFKFTTADIDTF